MKRFLSFEPPVFDLRIVTLTACAFLAGLYTAAGMDIKLAAHGGGNIIIPLALSLLRYMALTSMCLLCLRRRICIWLLVIYDASCAVVFGFYSYALFSKNTVVMLCVILPMLIYCYVMTVFTSAVLLPKNDILFAEEGEKLYNNDRIYGILAGRWRIIAAGIFLEGIVAPCL